MTVRIVEICSSPVFVAYPDQALAAAARELCAQQVGALVGIVTLDDLLPAIAQELKELADNSCAELRRRAQRAPERVSGAACS